MKSIVFVDNLSVEPITCLRSDVISELVPVMQLRNCGCFVFEVALVTMSCSQLCYVFILPNTVRPIRSNSINKQSRGSLERRSPNPKQMTNEEARDQLQLRTRGEDQLRTRGGELANVPALLFRFVVSKSQAFASMFRYGLLLVTRGEIELEI